MKIGVMSDTHDQLSNLIHALQVFRENNIKTVIHCGDLTNLDMVSHFDGFRVIYTFGNMDITTGAIRKQFKKLHEKNFAGMVFKGGLGGTPIAATHSHQDGKVMELLRERRFKWIFHGHTHEKRNEILQGVRIINPGALGGMGREPRTFCIVDLESEDVEFFRVG